MVGIRRRRPIRAVRATAPPPGPPWGRLGAALLALVLVSGCLFPPVDPDRLPGVLEPDGPDPSPGPETWVRAERSWEQAGEIEQAGSAGDVAVRSTVHQFRLPPHIQELELRLTWEPMTGEDLDVHFDLRDDGRSIWNASETGGRIGEPDAPVEVYVADEPRIDSANETLLVATVTAKFAYDMQFKVYTHIWFLEPVV